MNILDYLVLVELDDLSLGDGGGLLGLGGGTGLGLLELVAAAALRRSDLQGASKHQLPCSTEIAIFRFLYRKRSRLSEGPTTSSGEDYRGYLLSTGLTLSPQSARTITRATSICRVATYEAYRLKRLYTARTVCQMSAAPCDTLVENQSAAKLLSWPNYKLA